MADRQQATTGRSFKDGTMHPGCSASGMMPHLGAATGENGARAAHVMAPLADFDQLASKMYFLCERIGQINPDNRF